MKLSTRLMIEALTQFAASERACPVSHGHHNEHRRPYRHDGEYVMRQVMSEDEVKRAYQLRKQGLTFNQIAVAMGRKYNTIVNRFKWDAMTPEERQINRDRKREWRNTHYGKPKADIALPIARPTPEMLADRDRREALPHRDLTGAFFGDPPLGLSALEGRR